MAVEEELKLLKIHGISTCNRQPKRLIRVLSVWLSALVSMSKSSMEGSILIACRLAKDLGILSYVLYHGTGWSWSMPVEL